MTRMRRALRLLAFMVVLGSALAITPATPAAAHNCGSFNDCFFTADAASTALLGLIFLTALSIAIDFSPLGRARGIGEAIIGRDLLTGAELSGIERFAGLVPGARTARSARGLGGASNMASTRPLGPAGGIPPRRPPGGGGGSGRPPSGGGGGGSGGSGNRPPSGPGDPLPKPRVSDQKLQNYVDNLYKGTTNPTRVGTGTTADAVRRERLTGQPTGGVFHTTKAEETVNGLERWLRRNPDASYSDRLVAQSLLDDLLDALGRMP